MVRFGGLPGPVSSAGLGMNGLAGPVVGYIFIFLLAWLNLHSARHNMKHHNMLVYNILQLHPCAL